MAGYSVSMYDVTALRNGIAAELDAIETHLREVRASEATSADFGDSEAGSAYVRVVHGVLADSLTAFRSAGERVAEQLTTTVGQYEQLDAAGVDRFNQVGR